MIITKTIEWDMGHRIPNHKSKCRNPHGHRYRLEIAVSGKLVSKTSSSDQGMVIDFSDIKNILMIEIHDKCDHGFMYWKKDVEMSAFFKKNPDFKSIPVDFVPTAENISNWIFQKLQQKIKQIKPLRLTLVQVQLWETLSSSAISRSKNN